MFARTFTSRARRRGVVLIVVLGMLGLLAVIGFTFATFSNQAQINAKIFMFASAFPDSPEMMDYALAQLIDDSYNPQSVIRGHSLKRDMYGNDGDTNGYVPASWGFSVQTVVPGTGTYAGLLQCTTTMTLADPRLYGIDFRRWTIKFNPASGALLALGGLSKASTYVVGETQEVIAYATNPVTKTYDLYVRPPYDNLNNPTRIKGFTGNVSSNQQSVLPSQAQQPGEPSGSILGIPTGVLFSLDSRYRNAFNGAGALALGNDDGGGGILPTRALAEYGNFRYNGNIRSWNAKTVLTRSYAPYLGDPDAVFDDSNARIPIGMDEDYDACDLENWFLAIQSADGQVMIPSFHRPGILQANPLNPLKDNDWTRSYQLGTSAAQLQGIRAMSRILRPRQVDGNSSVSFPDLMPDLNTGKIRYDVDNDGDGTTDSVWLDLGYPSKRNPEGQLFKPLFAFMVIGLNGRLPLNTAGNLNDRDDHSVPTFTHADHLGNSPSEIDLRFALQNAFIPPNALNVTPDQPPITIPPTPPSNSQFDDSNPDLTTAGLGVNVPFTPYPNTSYQLLADKYRKSVADTQLRNILTGTRPYDTSNPLSNGDNNLVTVGGLVKNFPNSFGDAQDSYVPDPTQGSTPVINVVQRITPPVAGRWGEEDAVPGIIPTTYYPIGGVPGGLPLPIPTVPVSATQPQPIPAHFAAYNNYIRPGHSIILSDPGLQSGGAPRTYDGRDDNYNTFDVFPVLGNFGAANFPETADFYDDAGGILLPSERIRRFVTPIDSSGDGQVVTHPFNARGGGKRGGPVNDGADPFGRVSFFHYFRPPGVPLPTTYNFATPGGNDDVLGPFTTTITGSTVNYNSVPAPLLALNKAQSNNRYHGFISYLSPDYPIGGAVPGRGIYYSAMPWDDGVPTNPILELSTSTPNFPTFSTIINSKGVPTGFPGSLDPPPWSMNNPSSNGMSEADEMDLYTPNRFDAAFSPSDLEWLYRAQDVDGASLRSRLSTLAPVSLVWASDSNRRRRLFALDSWDMNYYAYTNDNPAGVLPRNSRYNSWNNASLFNQNVPTPSIAQGGHRVNLNFPLPVSNSPIEPVRQKWIRETYTLLKQILPPKAVDTPEELAQLSQYVVNIIDFRDPDCTTTKFVNTDIVVTPAAGNVPLTLGLSGLVASPFDSTIKPSTNPANYLIQYGMEYPPVAINEVLAFKYYTGITPVTTAKTPMGSNYQPVMYFELVNMLTKDHIPNIFPSADSSDLDLNGWDLVVMPDDATGRPDPFTGQVPSTTPFASKWFNGNLSDNSNPPANGLTAPLFLRALAPDAKFAGGNFTGEGTNYYFVFGNTLPVNQSINPPNPALIPNAAVDLTTLLDPLANRAKLPDLVTDKYYWLYLRRPPNPFDNTYDPANPNDNRVVVDSFRFYYSKARGTAYTPTPPGGADAQDDAPVFNQIFSLERMQPYRGGHAVPPIPGVPTVGSYTNTDPKFVIPAYGYSEQAAASTQTSTWSGAYKSVATYPGVDTTKPISHTLGASNSPQLDHAWDYLQFNDRDFTSIVELLMVPGTSPGLFTKQFCEQPPPIVGIPPLAPTPYPAAPITGSTIPLGLTPWPVVTAFNGNGEPHPNPYLADEFFYTGANENTWPQGVAATQASIITTLGAPNTFHPVWQSLDKTLTLVSNGGPSGAGWYKMLEFFEVPSMAFKAIGPVSQGVNYDWMRQDLRAGQLNLNLIVDEEVFLGLMGPSLYGPVFSANQGVMNEVQLVNAQTPAIASMVDDNGAPLYKYNMTNVGIVDTYVDPTVDPATDPQLTNGYRTNNRMKACFSDFLKLRHGGSGYLYAWGSGGVGYNGLPLTVGGVTTPIAADRPFRSLSFPDINYTILRPATLPPSSFPFLPTNAAFVYPTPTINPSPTPPLPYNSADFFNNIFAAYPPQPYPNPNIGSTPSFPIANAPYFYTQDPGVKNPYLFTRTDPVQPQPIPARRLFQVPDYWGYNNPLDANRHMIPKGSAAATGNASSAYNFTGVTIAPGPLVTLPYYATGDPAVNNQTLAPALSRDVTDLTSAPNYIAPTFIPPTIYLGGANPTGAGPVPDQRDHPYFRTEWLQKVANLTTPRTHQFAVWITVGFFEVTFQGNPALALSNNPAVAAKAYDLFGLELGKLEGKNIRYRSFFLLDRTKATGFNPTQPGDFRNVVVYRQLIE